MALSLMPDYIYQQFTASGKPLSGGTIYFYQSGTLTPKTVYADAAGTTALGTSVTLSASGTAVIFLDSGAYRIWVKDSTGAPVAAWVDGIVGGGVTGVDGSNATVGFFLVYDDLRAMSVGPEMAYVTGRTAEGDGGAGWFQKLPASSVTDDGGIFLTAAGGSIVYKRVFSGPIDPEWYGVQYAVNADQSAALIAALAGSAALNFPVYASKRIYLTMPVTVPAGAALEAGEDGYFNSPGSVTMTFAAGSRFDARGVTFGASVQPVFVATATDAIRLSWMGGTTDDARWLKLAASSTADYVALCDDSTLISMDLTIPKNFSLDFLGGAKINITSALNLSIGTFAYSGDAQVVSYADMADVGAVAIGAQNARPEWFGAVGDGATDDSIAFLAAAKNGAVSLIDKKNYLLGTLWSATPSPLLINGGKVTLGTGKTLGTGDLFLESCAIAKPSGSWFSGAYLHALNSEFPNTYTAAQECVTGCKYPGVDPFSPLFRGAPTIYNPHLGGMYSIPLLGTDILGKVIDASDHPEVNLLSLNGLVVGPTLPLSGAVTLANPLGLAYSVNNAYGDPMVDITLPVLSGFTQPNIVMFFPAYGGAVYRVRSQNGNITRIGSTHIDLASNQPAIFIAFTLFGTWTWSYMGGN